MILKLNSTGPLVIDLQNFLKLKADGVFGPDTEKAVKKWQSDNGLVADGVVGPKTWEAMGLATTDVSEKRNQPMSPSTIPFNIIQHFLPKGQYYEGPTKKRWIYLHHTAGWESPYSTIAGWAADNRGAVATEFVLGGPSILGNNDKFDGVLVQCFPEGGYGWHLGTGNDAMHRESVGIEVCNFGPVTKGGYFKWDIASKRNVWIKLKSESFYTYVGTEANPSQIIELDSEFRGFKYWHKYSDKQVQVLKDWIIYIGNRDNIDIRKGIVEQIHKHGIEAFNKVDIALCNKTPGVWLHTNVQAGKVDLFPQPEIVEMLLSL